MGSIAKPPTTKERGYGNAHKRLRAKYEPLVRSGEAICWRCGRLIDPNGTWDLGHDDNDRTKYRGPEHVSCNRGAPHRHRGTTPPIPDVDTSRAW